MILETGVPLIESASAITAAMTLLVGAVRVIPQKHLRLEILDNQNNNNNKRSKKTLAGNVFIPHNHSAAVGINSKNGGLQTIIFIKDKSTHNPRTSRAFIMGLNRKMLGFLSNRRRIISLPSLGVTFKYYSPKNSF